MRVLGSWGIGHSKKPIKRSLMRQMGVRELGSGGDIGWSEKSLERSLMRQMRVGGLDKVSGGPHDYSEIICDKHSEGLVCGWL